jgi:ribose transport system substrate-binding protein
MVCVAAVASSVGIAPASARSGDAALRSAVKATNAAYAGTSRPVDPTARPAVPDKHVVVISAGQASLSAKMPADAAVEAAEELGWRADVYDGQLTPASYGPLVRQAIAAGADGIVLVTIDCQAVKEPLVEARKAGIEVTAISGFDCDDPKGGGDRAGLFSAPIDVGTSERGLGPWVAAYGAAQANYVIAKSKNKARILMVRDPEFTTLEYVDQGFERTIARSKGSEIVETVDVTTADFLSNQLVPKIQAALLRHPEADWVRSPYTYATTLGVVPALGTRADDLAVMGGEGYEPELDLIRAGKVAAANVVVPEWQGWAAIDTLNSAFRDEDPVDSGLGFTMVDRDHNLTPSGPFEPAIDFKAAYRKAWGLG